MGGPQGAPVAYELVQHCYYHCMGTIFFDFYFISTASSEVERDFKPTPSCLHSPWQVSRNDTRRGGWGSSYAEAVVQDSDVYLRCNNIRYLMLR